MVKNSKTIKPIALGDLPVNIQVAPSVVPNGQQPVFVPQQQYIQQPQYVQPIQQPQYYEQFHVKPLSTNLVAIAGIGIFALGVYMYFGGSLLPSFLQPNADKEQDKDYALLAQRFYEGLGYVQGIGRDMNTLYAVAQEIADSGDTKMWENVQKWYAKKYGKSIKTSISNQMNTQEINKFYQILGGKIRHDEGVQSSVNNTMDNGSVINQVKQIIGSSTADTTQISSKYRNGMYVVSIVKNHGSTVKVRTSPMLNNSSSSNRAISHSPNGGSCMGIATGKMFRTVQKDGDKTTTLDWIELVVRVKTENFDKFLAAVPKVHRDYYSTKKNEITGSGLLLYVYEGSTLLTKYRHSGVSWSDQPFKSEYSVVNLAPKLEPNTSKAVYYYEPI